ncbi:MAG TPA: helix-turn-helix domain-containing protein [Patescibacteria group bacterium]|jgi:excisionase family DNA binding protein|nr:helix-turn-helix domain-containing protein [Patescibacteria group bacterium]
MIAETTLMTVREAAQYLRLSSLTIYDYIHAGKLKAVKFGRNYRIVYRDLLQFVDSHKIP